MIVVLIIIFFIPFLFAIYVHRYEKKISQKCSKQQQQEYQPKLSALEWSSNGDGISESVPRYKLVGKLLLLTYKR